MISVNAIAKKINELDWSFFVIFGYHVDMIHFVRH